MKRKTIILTIGVRKFLTVGIDMNW